MVGRAEVVVVEMVTASDVEGSVDVVALEAMRANRTEEEGRCLERTEERVSDAFLMAVF
jgi:hypothetical protein